MIAGAPKDLSSSNALTDGSAKYMKSRDLVFDSITHEYHPTEWVDIGAGVVGQFSSNYLTENGRIIPILSQICINGSVEYLVISDFHRTDGPMWVDNLLATRSSWGDGTPNQKWPLSQPRNVSVPWNGAVPAPPGYMPAWSPDNMCAAAHRIHDEWLCGRRCARMRSPSTSFSPVLNPRINHRGDDQEGPVDQ